VGFLLKKQSKKPPRTLKVNSRWTVIGSRLIHTQVGHKLRFSLVLINDSCVGRGEPMCSPLFIRVDT